METSGVKKEMGTRVNIANAILGIWVIIAPFVLGFTRSVAVIWNNIAAGALVALLALVTTRKNAPRGVSVLLGAWLIASPFVFGYRMPPLFWNDIMSGALILIFTLLNSPMRTAEIPPGGPPEA